MLKVVECEGQIERKTIDKPFHDLWLAFVHCSSRGREKTLRGGTWGIPQPRLHAISDVRSLVTRLWREFSEQYGGAITNNYSQRLFGRTLSKWKTGIFPMKMILNLGMRMNWKCSTILRVGVSCDANWIVAWNTYTHTVHTYIVYLITQVTEYARMESRCGPAYLLIKS